MKDSKNLEKTSVFVLQKLLIMTIVGTGWSLSPHNYKVIDIYINKNLEYLLPYSEKELSKYMYISGAYWVAKKVL